MIWVALGFGGLFALYWFWWSSPSQERIDALRRAFQDDPGEAHLLLEALPKRFHLEVLFQVMRDLMMDDAYEAGRRALIEVAERDPVAATGHAEVLAEATGDADFGVAICEKALDQSPKSISALFTMARILANAGRVEDALEVLARRPDEPDLMALRADLLEQTGQVEEALDVAERLERFGADNRSRMVDPEESHRALDLQRQAGDLRRKLTADLDPEFDPWVDLAKSGELKPRSGANHWMLGIRMRLDESPNEVALFDPVAVGREVFDRLVATPNDPEVRRLAGECQLRTRDPVRAARVFSSLVADDPTDFVAQLGLGAALRASEERWYAGSGGLPEANVPCPQWFPDLPALTGEEQRIVTASIGELGRFLTAPVRIRPLAHVPSPVDPASVMAADLEDLDPFTGWSLARHVALEAWLRLPDEARLAVAELFDSVRDRPELAGEADIDSLEGFFADAWVQLLTQRWLDAPRGPVGAGLERIVSALPE